jgi:hypothetical protein
MMKEARDIQNDFVKQVEPLLTKEQAAEWQKIRQEMRDEAMQRLRNR